MSLEHLRQSLEKILAVFVFAAHLAKAVNLF
jgi:hypothetical protein